MLVERKYALLQASAVIFAETLDHDNSGMDEKDLAESAVARAKLLLDTIEKRDMENTLDSTDLR